MELPFKKTVAIGLGGIWSYLYILLGRLSVFNPVAPKDWLLVDGDKFTASNRERQDMVERDNGRYKADVYTDRMKARYPELIVSSLPRFVVSRVLPEVESERVALVREVIPDGSIVLVSVDNHPARYLVSKHAQTLSNVLLISGGNDEWTGNAQAYLRLDGKDVTVPIERIHPEIAEEKGARNPGDMSCDERLALKGETQWAVTNNMAAAHMVALFDRFLRALREADGLLRIRKVYAEDMFDVTTGSACGYIRSASSTYGVLSSEGEPRPVAI